MLLCRFNEKSGTLLHYHGDVLSHNILDVGQASYSGFIIKFLFVRFPIGFFVEYLILWAIV